jgi:hypothetical protein
VFVVVAVSVAISGHYHGHGFLFHFEFVFFLLLHVNTIHSCACTWAIWCSSETGYTCLCLVCLAGDAVHVVAVASAAQAVAWVNTLWFHNKFVVGHDFVIDVVAMLQCWVLA